MSAAAFLSKLPPDRLTPGEVELRDLLLRTAASFRRVGRGQLALQQWAERRMPGEVTLSVDAGGHITLGVPEPKQEARPGGTGATAAATGRAPPTGRGPPPNSGARPSAIEAFFNKLPNDSFTQEEEFLRSALTTVLGKGATTVTQIVTEPQVSPAAKALLPSGVPLIDWIEHRIGAEVLVIHEDGGQCLLKLASGGKEEKRETFFAGLPDGSFTQEEENLRSALFDFLASWKSQDLATLSHAGGDKGVQTARIALLPQGVALRDWIERRIGGEVELTKDAKGQFVVHLTPAARQTVARRFQEMDRGNFQEAPGPEEAKQAVKEDFFNQLPTDELLPAELELRQALLDFLHDWNTKKPGAAPPVLSDAGQDKRLQQCKAALLPKEAPLKEWIERRIGGEIVTGRDPRGQVAISLRGARRDRGRREKGGPERPSGTGSGSGAPGGEADGAPPAKTDEEKEAARLAVEERREAFFAELPEDGFTENEEKMRQAILNFLEHWKSSETPTLSSVGGDPKVREARALLLPRGSGISVSMKEWIDRRIGGEVETFNDGAQIAIGLRGKVDSTGAAARAAKKRKADSDGPQGDGPGSGAGARGTRGGKGGKGPARPAGAAIGHDPQQGPLRKKGRGR